MTLADWLIQCTSSAIIVLTGLTLNIQSITANALPFFFILVTFGFALVQLVNIFAHPFNKKQEALKHSMTLVIAYYFTGIFMHAYYREHNWPPKVFTFVSFEIAIIKVIAERGASSSNSGVETYMGYMIA